jgi:hypothetical protein
VITESLEGWTPIRVGWRAGEPVVDWCYTEGVPFTEPFFSETVETCFRNPFRLLFRRETDMETVGRFVDDHPGITPAGFIFHMSRCGSTLIAQLLGAMPEHLVLSEPGPVDTVLRARAPERDRSRWLVWMLAALGQARTSGQRKLFVKFDAWSALHLPLVRRTFPEVPWLFVYRDPVEVLASHMRHRGAHVIPGVLPDLFESVPPHCSPTEYAARVLVRICEAALDCKQDRLGTFVEYRQLPDFVVSDLATAWSVSLDEARLREVAGRDAKNPVLPFEDDGRLPRAGAAPEVRAAADRWLLPLYQALDEARAAQ